MANYLTIDVGGTNVKYALMSEEAEIIEKGEYPTPYEGGLDAFMSGLKELYAKYEGQFEGVAMSAPGKIDATKGYFYTSGALGYLNGINLAEKIAEFSDIPFAVENDAKAAALAELWKGSLQGVKNGLVIVLGTGIGGAVIVDGKLHRGTTFAAGELSGIPLHLDDAPYKKSDTWSQQNGVGFLVVEYAKRIGTDPTILNGRILFEAANNGNKDAIDAIDYYCSGLAAGIMSIQFVLDVEKVAIGGGISKQPLLMTSLQKNIHAYYDHVVGDMPASIPEIASCEFGNDANMIGALYHYLFELKK